MTNHKAYALLFAALLAACGSPATNGSSIATTQTIEGDTVGTVTLSPEVPPPDYGLDKSQIRIFTDTGQRVVHTEGYLDLLPRKVAAQRYVVYAGSVRTTIADVLTAFAEGHPKPLDPRIFTDQLLITGGQILPVDRTLILQTADMSSYQFMILHFSPHQRTP